MQGHEDERNILLGSALNHLQLTFRHRDGHEQEIEHFEQNIASYPANDNV